MLATSLDHESAQSIVAIYATRMQVEELFRDTKNARFGWGLELARSTSTLRLDDLLLLVTLAFAAIVLLGAAAFDCGLEKRFRASSRKERVLSLFSLGNLVARNAETRLLLRASNVWKRIESGRRVSRSSFPEIPELLRIGLGPNVRRHHDRYCTDCGWDSTNWFA